MANRSAPGQPRLPVARARVPVPLLNAVHNYATRTGTNPSEALRQLVIVGLTERGHWPPPASEAA